MTDRSKIIFVNASGDYEETSSADSLSFASYKTATYELTDALLGDVVNKMIKSDGARAFAANQPMGGYKLTGLAAGSASGESIRYEQLVAVQNQIAGLEFQDSVINVLSTPAVGPASGDRYLIGASATGAWAGKEDNIAQWNGSAWVFTPPTTGMLLSNDAQSDRLKYYTGSAWVDRFFEATTASTGLVKVGMDIRLDSSAAGDGLGFSSGVLNVNVDGSTIETNADTLRIKDLGVGTGKLAATSVTAAKLGSDVAGSGLTGGNGSAVAVDWASSASDNKAWKASDLSAQTSGKGASAIGIQDAGNFTGQTSVEGALQELYGLSGASTYTVGTGGVTAGDLVYMSANNTVRKFTSIGTQQRAIGLALATVSAAGQVAVKRADDIVAGCLSGATFGVEYFWDGSAPTATMPTGSGSNVWKIGVAVNATDLRADVEFVKKNS